MLKVIKKVIDYLNISYHEALELPTDLFMLAFKNQYILELESTEEGREYLKLCERLNTTELDYNALMDFKKEVN